MFRTEKEKIKYLLSKKDTRIKLCENRLDLFAFHYFREFFTHKSKKFHFDWYKDAMEHERNILNVWFRDSGKTAIFWLILIIWCICYKKYSFMCFYAFEKDKAKAKTLNIVNLLKANKYIKEDFWYLFKDHKSSSSRKDIDTMQEQKTIDEFITTNWIKVKAMSMNMSPRWEQFVNHRWEVVRPELVLLDDIDINKSVRNVEVIDNNYAFITWEVMGWIANYGRIIFLGNIIWEDWVIPRLLKEQEFNDSWIVRDTPLLDDADNIAWPEKFVWSDKEAKEINSKITDNRYQVVSLESKLKSQGLNAFNSNYRNKPYQIIWDPVFAQENIDKLKVISPISWFNIVVNKVRTRLQIFDNTYMKEPLVAGIDVWWGIGKDYTEIAMKNDKWKLVATWSSNSLQPSYIVHVLTFINDKLWIDFYKNGLVIENNNKWDVIIEWLKIENPYLYKLLFRPKPISNISQRSSRSIGWNTNDSTKDILIWALSLKIDSWEIEVTEEIKSQFRTYIIDEDWKYNAQYWSYDDKVIAYALVEQALLHYKI